MSHTRILAAMNPKTNERMCKNLQSKYDVKCVGTLRPTLQAIKDFDPELIIIDIDTNTEGKVRRITQAAKAHYRHPFIILIKSGRAAPRFVSYYDKVVSKPFIFKRLNNAIEKLMESRSDYVIQLPPFTLDRRTGVLIGPKGKQRLNPKLAKLMETFMMNSGEPVNPLTLMKEVWGTEVVRDKDTRTLHVHIHWLRQIIEDEVSAPQYLKTVAKNKGYILDIPGQVAIGGEPLYAPEM